MKKCEKKLLKLKKNVQKFLKNGEKNKISLFTKIMGQVLW